MPVYTPDDRSLLARYAAESDDDAFRTLVDRHASLVYGVCRRRLGSTETAEDAAQLVFLALARSAPQLAKRANLVPWLYACAHNIAIGLLRKEARWSRMKLKIALTVERQPQETGMDPRLDDALARLGAQDREAVLLRYAEEYSLAEVGKALGVSEDAARMRVNRAIDRLRRDLAKQGLEATALLGAIRVPCPEALRVRLRSVPGDLPLKTIRPRGGRRNLMSTAPTIPLLIVTGIVLIGVGTTAFVQTAPPSTSPAPPKPSIQPLTPLSDRETSFADLVKEFPGSWKVTMWQIEGGKKTISSRYPTVTVRFDPSKKALVIYGANPNPVDPPMESTWLVDPTNGTLDMSTKANPTPPFVLTAKSKQPRKKSLTFEALINGLHCQTTFTYDHRQITLDYATTPAAAPTHAYVTFDRK